MLLEDQRVLHEDLERLEQAVTERVAEDPRNIKDRLNRDHQIDGFLVRIQEQSKRLLDIYRDAEGLRAKEVQILSTGDPFDEFYKEFEQVREHHRQYPNEPVENLERAYKRRRPDEGEPIVSEIDNMFTGEEGNGRFLDLTTLHEDYLNLPGVKRLTYLQYLDNFDAFEPPRLPIKRQNKVTDTYLKYVTDLDAYLETFVRRTRPLDDLQALFLRLSREFETAWDKHEVPGWPKEESAQSTAANGPQTEGTGTGIWCTACEKDFANPNVYKAHLTGKKHIRNAEAKQSTTSNGVDPVLPSTTNLKQRIIASHEHRIRALADLLSTERSNTRVNVERKQGMTERERQVELDALFAEDDAAIYESYNRDLNGANGDRGSDAGDGNDSDGERIYNPLKLPLAWDGKPIPYWLYKLHGLGVEFTCEICGNFVYMGRRAFDKHFSETRHTYRLKCLGITNTSGSGGVNLFREITMIADAVALWEKLKRERREKESREGEVVQMEDGEGNVMPERIYLDLQKQGIL
ncbi:Pre-mRNA-splicing factor sap61 [Cyphellophora attinorum]|uniref:Pre-mRNA-splicing factor sap61 n=1 Tax=Cyphellophora attinorum TaxID=1664694 RepID=A0A0N1H236_9EURO|nr:Pre-mRNA-splicing factor sap61 [Phialophora attinorum]KPI38622.1 Pre-mRNA-splicing factor sap61 [Phialophora attinorum]